MVAYANAPRLRSRGSINARNGVKQCREQRLIHLPEGAIDNQGLMYLFRRRSTCLGEHTKHLLNQSAEI